MHREHARAPGRGDSTRKNRQEAGKGLPTSRNGEEASTAGPEGGTRLERQEGSEHEANRNGRLATGWCLRFKEKTPPPNWNHI